MAKIKQRTEATRTNTRAALTQGKILITDEELNEVKHRRIDRLLPAVSRASLKPA